MTSQAWAGVRPDDPAPERSNGHGKALGLRRVAARLLDLVIAFLPLVAVALTTDASSTPAPRGFADALRDGMGSVAVLTFLLLPYVLLEAFALVRHRGRTVGKWLFCLQVERTDAKPLRPRDAAVRLAILLAPVVLFWVRVDDTSSALNAVSDVIGLALLLNALAVLVLQRGLHDLAAGTRVVRHSAAPLTTGSDSRPLVPIQPPARPVRWPRLRKLGYLARMGQDGSRPDGPVLAQYALPAPNMFALAGTLAAVGVVGWLITPSVPTHDKVRAVTTGVMLLAVSYRNGINKIMTVGDGFLLFMFMEKTLWVHTDRLTQFRVSWYLPWTQVRLVDDSGRKVDVNARCLFADHLLAEQLLADLRTSAPHLQISPRGRTRILAEVRRVLSRGQTGQRSDVASAALLTEWVHFLQALPGVRESTARA